jgi:NAD(P)-dependent dehydrogenase (short-subunit alcohol dehydrogenase family)
MVGICDGRVVIVTGAGGGIGRSHALVFAQEGAMVVVNDIGADVNGRGSSTGPAGEVVDAIRAAGGQAVANGDDVADWEGGERLIRTAPRRVRWPRRPRQQRWHPPGSNAGEHDC